MKVIILGVVVIGDAHNIVIIVTHVEVLFITRGSTDSGDSKVNRGSVARLVLDAILVELLAEDIDLL